MCYALVPRALPIIDNAKFYILYSAGVKITPAITPAIFCHIFDVVRMSASDLPRKYPRNFYHYLRVSKKCHNFVF